MSIWRPTQHKAKALVKLVQHPVANVDSSALYARCQAVQHTVCLGQLSTQVERTCSDSFLCQTVGLSLQGCW